MKYVRRGLYVLLPLLIVLVGWTQRFEINDWWRLRGYDPPARIVQLADQTAMTDLGRKLFYVNHPELNDKQTFNDNCTISEQSIVLGCYVNSQGIYLYDVTDERLLGVHQVTAAHEMLHAAYDRLGMDEKTRVDKLTQEVFEQLNDARLNATIQAYRDRDPSVIPNELHSILATEVETLPTELEDYYKQYFTDRQTVVRYSRQYEAAFQERKDKIAAFDAQLAAIRQEIETNEAELTSLSAQISADRAELDALLAARDYQRYNSRVPGFNQKVRNYNATVNEIRAAIDTHNQLVIDRNAVALEENELVEAIDSRPDTIPTE